MARCDGDASAFSPRSVGPAPENCPSVECSGPDENLAPSASEQSIAHFMYSMPALRVAASGEIRFILGSPIAETAVRSSPILSSMAPSFL